MSLFDLLSKDIEAPEPAKGTKLRTRLDPTVTAFCIHAASPNPEIFILWEANHPEPSKPALVPRALLNKKVAKVTKATAAVPKVLSTTITASKRASNTLPTSSENREPNEESEAPKLVMDDLMSFHSISDLYDPLAPNDYYESVYKPRKELLKKEEIEKMQKQAQEETESVARSKSSAMETDSGQKGIIPASMFGEKVLYKQGWKGIGFGLGKDDQGISTPFIGVEAGTVSIDGSMKTTGAISRAPTRLDTSRVLLIRNMVGKGKVDADLQSETFSECSVFGHVLRCTVQEQDDHIPCSDEEAVRVFVQFDSATSAEKARLALNRRTFAGRSVIASLYPEAAFIERKYWIPMQHAKT
jgi:hypothetical protein